MFIIYLALFIIMAILFINGTYVIGFVYVLLLYSCCRKYKLKITLLLQLPVLLFSFMVSVPQAQLPNELKGEVVEVGTYHYILKTDYGKIRVIRNGQEIEKGNHLVIEAEQETISRPSNFNAFDYRLYCFSQKIFYQVKETQILSNDGHQSWVHRAEWWIESFKNEKVVSMTKQLILGIKDEAMAELLEAGQNLSIVHLFALSGMHLMMLKKILERIGIRQTKWLLFLLGGYVLFLGDMISLWRAYLMLLFRYLLKDKANDVEILSGISILFCLYNPFVIYSLSYIFSFTIYAFILLAKGHRFSFIYPYLAGIPIVLYTQFSLNPFSLLFIWLFAHVIEYLYGIVLLNMACFNILGMITGFVISQFERVLYFLDHYSIEWIFMKPPWIFILFYYGFLLLSLYHEPIKSSLYKDYLKLAGILLILYFYPYLQPFSRVVMIDVGQGDCFLIMRPFHQGNYLIDTGGNQSYDLSKKRIIPYLKSIGIKELTALIITHDDFDHMGASESLQTHFKVNKVITKGEDIGILNYLPLPYVADDKNANSLVYYLSLNQLGYLFTGDLPIAQEEQLLARYPQLNVNVLKVGHHGSNTSTGALLLSTYLPQYGLISVGKNNLYHHPNTTVLERLEAYDVNVYRSDTMGMVEIISLFGIHRINYCRKT